MADCDARSPLVHSGTTQTDRDLGELAVPYFRIDERELADLVLYAQALSREVRYYAPDNTPGETWEAFFASDITATLATLARLPVEAFRTAAADAEEFLKGEPPRPEADLRAYFNLLFHLPVALFGEMARTLQRLPRDHALHGQLQRLVETELMRPLTALLRFYKGAIGAGLPLGTPEPALDP